MKRRLFISAAAWAGCRSAWALYDPPPDAVLASVQGEWTGSLTYRDYSGAQRMVTLPTRLFVALAGPNELSLHYVFADGGSKTVYSYESMRFDAARKELTWVSGSAEKSASAYAIVSSTDNDAGRMLVFERSRDGGTDRFTLALAANALSLGKDEISASGTAQFRNRYQFKRPGDAR